jgi:hypothetical protein
MRRPLSRSLPLALSLLASSCGGPPAQTPADHGPPLPVVEYVTQQEILTALPLRVRLPDRYGAERVLVFVHLWGTRDWTHLELAREGQTWAGEVSCRAVSTVTGDTRYFFLALDRQGQVVVGSGSPGWPHVATIVGKLADGPQALAGEAAPLRCHDPADCPPDFPGCPAYAILRPRGATPGSARAAGAARGTGTATARRKRPRPTRGGATRSGSPARCARRRGGRRRRR